MYIAIPLQPQETNCPKLLERFDNPLIYYAIFWNITYILYYYIISYFYGNISNWEFQVLLITKLDIPFTMHIVIPLEPHQTNCPELLERFDWVRLVCQSGVSYSCATGCRWLGESYISDTKLNVVLIKGSALLCR